MSRPFDWFVMLAGMRTGSNLLESRLNAVPGLACHGEAFNPQFIGQPGRDSLLGITRNDRDRDARPLLDRIRQSPGLNGFRLFDTHDPRALAHVLADPRCAKIVLTRNPLDSYVSRRIAEETGQWLIRGDGAARRSARIRFSPPQFEGYLDSLQDHQLRLQRALQTTGQTAFWIDYEDLDDLAVFNGLLRFLGLPPVAALAGDLIKQNPEPLADKVENPAEMQAGLAQIDRFNLGRTPNFEARRGPAVPGFVASDAGLLMMPIRGTGEARLRDWLAGTGALTEGFNQKTLRQWQMAHPGHRSFAVLRHPLPRAWVAFRDLILTGRHAEARDHLTRVHRLPLDTPDPAATLPDAFAVFLRWLKLNLNGQTPLRPHAAWASQSAVVSGFAQLAVPGRLIHEPDLPQELDHLARLVGTPCPPLSPDTDGLKDLAGFLTPALQRLAREAYPRDYTAFGFDDWRAC